MVQIQPPGFKCSTRNPGTEAIMSDELKSVLKGAAVAAAGAILTYVSQWATGQDFGPWQPIIAAGLAVAANIFRKWAGMP